MPFEITFPGVSVIAATDIGAARQGTGSHTLYGAALPLSDTHYWWVTVDGLGVDPALSGMTGVRVSLVGAGPFTGASLAAAAETAAAGLGYTLERTDATVSVSGGDIDTAAAQAVADALVAFGSRGGGGVIGALDNSGGASIGSDTTGWIQVNPSDVPSGPFRVVGFELYRGTNVTNDVRMAVASGGGGNGDPEGATVDHQRVMGNSGASTLHREWLDSSEVVSYSGGERIFIGTHGSNLTSSIVGGSGIDAGLWADGSSNSLWLTDGTSGESTPFASPVGAVTSQFNFGIIARIIIQEAPYQTDGGYRVIVGAVPGVHDQDLFAGVSEVEDIFVGWGVRVPTLADLYLYDTQVRFTSHASGATNQKRVELWSVGAGGSTTFVGDTLVSLVGVSTDTQGTGWTSIQSVDPVALTSGGAYRYTMKGAPSTGVVLGVDVGGAGVDARAPAYALGLTAPTAYPITDTFEAEEVEVQGASVADVGVTPETVIDFDPQVATASPNAADGEIVYPGNIGMIALYVGTAAPTYVTTAGTDNATAGSNALELVDQGVVTTTLAGGATMRIPTPGPYLRKRQGDAGPTMPIEVIERGRTAVLPATATLVFDPIGPGSATTVPATLTVAQADVTVDGQEARTWTYDVDPDDMDAYTALPAAEYAVTLRVTLANDGELTIPTSSHAVLTVTSRDH